MNTQLTNAEMNEAMSSVDDNLMMDFDAMHSQVQAPQVTTEEPIARSTSRAASKMPTMSQIAQLTATTVTKTILDQYEGLLPQKAAMGALAVIRTMFAVNAVGSYELYLRAAISKSKYTNSKNNDKKAFHIKTDGHGVLKLAVDVGYIVITDGVVTPTPKWSNMIVAHVPVSPSTSIISKKKDERLRTSIMKSNVKACENMQEGVFFLEATEYSVYRPTLSTAEQVYERCVELTANIVMQGKPAAFKSSMQYRIQHRAVLKDMFPEELVMVLQGCNAVKGEKSLWSEYDADARGRLYHVMCFGPNPQASDLARATYSLNTHVQVDKYEEGGIEFTPAYKLFLEELADIGGGKFNQHKTRAAVAERGVDALTKWHTTNCEAPKKPFTYERMCKTYMDFETYGAATCTIGYGLDAKCSGTQYLAILAGDMKMAAATGLTDSEVRGIDPYLMSLEYLYKAREDFILLGLDRSFIKTPYMAVQYGGSVKALVGSRDFLVALKERGITNLAQVADIAESCVDAIKLALGDKINAFILATQGAVERKCEALGKDYFQYKHSDGLLVKKPGYKKIEICQSFIIRIEEGEQLVFGQLDEHGKPLGEWVMTSKVMDAEEFARTFVVNFIQGLDAIVARTFAVHAKAAGLRGVTSIHDCFRCTLADAPKMKEVIAGVYKEVFIDTDQLEHLRSQLGELDYYAENIVTEELLNHENSYYFCI
jgi:hypothetical protein